jgi:hypothetical protein
MLSVSATSTSVSRRLTSVNGGRRLRARLRYRDFDDDVKRQLDVHRGMGNAAPRIDKGTLVPVPAARNCYTARPMSYRLAATALTVLLSPLLLPQPHAQDMEAMMKWASADVVKYHIVGVYSAKTNIVAGANDVGNADVTDRVVIDLTWKLSELKLVGTPTIVNEKSRVANLTNYDPKCAPPTISGDYEHATVLSIKEGLGGSLAMQVQQTYPTAKVIQFCTGAPKTVAGRTETTSQDLEIVSPILFAMPLTDSEPVTISPDKKSLIVKKDGWTWTYTPTAG